MELRREPYDTIMKVFAGVDGGGTKTKVLLWTCDTEEGLMITSGPSRPTMVGFNESRNVIVRAIYRGLTELDARHSDIASLSICLSGIDSEADSKHMKDVLSTDFPDSNIEVVNDAFAAVAAGSLGKGGIAVIGGTGSIAIGERENGFSVRAGGYGDLLGDEGSGFDIGRRGLASAIMSFEDRGPYTELWNLVSRSWNVKRPLDLVDVIYSETPSESKVAQFAETVIGAAPYDAVARRIVHHAARAYSGLVKSVRRQAGESLGNSIILAGGLFKNNEILRSSLQELLPTDSLVVLKREPVLGALIRSLRSSVHSNRLEKSILPRILESKSLRAVETSVIESSSR